MNKIKHLMACLGTTSLFGWGGAPAHPPVQPYLESNFPLNEDQQWFTKETYLIMKPYEDDNDYATKLTTEGSTTSGVNMSLKLQKPDFDWYSGVRLGLGRYLANHDKWDITLFTTYFYAQEESSSSPKRSSGTLLTPLWSPTFDGGATKGNVVWRLNFFNWDLSVGREYSLLRTVVAHPFIGLRAALIYKDYFAKYSDTFISGSTIDRTLNDKFKATDEFWGIGPRAGVDLQFKFEKQWALLGNLSAALFYGRYDVREEISTKITSFGVPTTSKFHIKDERYTVRANLDTSLGIGWETWLNEHRVRIAPSVMFEGSCWFDTNQFFLVKTKISGPDKPDAPLTPFGNFRRQGNLILMGFSFNIQADF